jgi:hypothetical protein
MFIYCPTNNHSPHILYLLSHIQSLTIQCISSVPQQITHHNICIYSLTNSHSPHNVYLLSHKLSLTTQIISIVPHPITYYTVYISYPTNNHSPHNLYLLSHNQSLTPKFVSTVSQPVTPPTLTLYLHTLAVTAATKTETHLKISRLTKVTYKIRIYFVKFLSCAKKYN